MKTQKALLTIVLFSLLPFSAWSADYALPSDYSDSEGYLSAQHDQEMQTLRTRFFLDQDGTVNPQKIQTLIEFLKERRAQVTESARMSKKEWLITKRYFNDKDASKSAADVIGAEAEELAPFEFTIAHAENLLKEIERNPESVRPGNADHPALRSSVETALLMTSTAYTTTNQTIYSKTWKMIKNIYHNFYDLKLNDIDQVQASNLVYNGQFLSPLEIRNQQKQGMDISQINPPSSAFWYNNKVEDYDPKSEKFFDKTLFPPREEQVPEFYFKRMGWGQIKLKTFWLDKNKLNNKGQPKKRSVTLRLGWESYTSTVVNHLARIVGYHANATAYRAKVKLYLEDMNYEEFCAQWLNAHSKWFGSPLTYIERIPGENAVYLHNVSLEATPADDEYRQMGPFRLAKNGIDNRREFRAMVLYNGLINLQDTGEGQVRVDAWKDPKTNLWMPQFMISDTGVSMGIITITTNSGTVNEYPRFFTKRTDENLWILWQHGDYEAGAWQTTTYSDAKWLARRYARISEKQISDIMTTSGFPAPAQAIYIEKIKERINDMIRNFELEKEGFKQFSIKPNSELQKEFPKYINERGHLTWEAGNIPDVRVPILGFRMTAYQVVLVGAISFVQEQFSKAVETLVSSPISDQKIEMGETTLSNGFKIGGSRTVTVNKENSELQKRFLLKDTYRIRIPLGIESDKVETPVALYYEYVYDYYHSVTTPKEVALKGFFNTMNPFEISSVRKHLALGEQLTVSHGFGVSVGKVRVEATKDIRFNLSLFGIEYDKLNEFYISKTSEDMVEITHSGLKTKEFSAGLDTRAYIRLAAEAKKSFSEKNYSLYRLDFFQKSEEQQAQMTDAFTKALLDSDFKQLTQVGQTYDVNDSNIQKESHLGFFLWGWDWVKNSGTMDISGNISDLVSSKESVEKDGTKSVTLFSAQASYATDRAMDRLWTDKVAAGGAEGGINFFTDILAKGKSFKVTFEGVANENYTDFAETSTQFDIMYLDNYASRDTYDNDFRKYFGQITGDPNYIDYRMPKELSYYSPLYANMRWQMREVGLKNILKGIQQSYVELGKMSGKENDARLVYAQQIENVLKPLSADLSLEKRKQLLQQKAEKIARILKRAGLSTGKGLASLRRFADDKNLWIFTRVDHILERQHPTFESEKENFYYPKEIGSFQGHGFLARLKSKKVFAPYIRQNLPPAMPNDLNTRYR